MSTSQISRISLLAVGLALLVGGGCRSQPTHVAKVGKRSLTQQDVQLRVKQQALEKKNPISPSIALAQLVKAYLAAEILEKYEQKVTKEALEIEAARIDSTTLMPMKLQSFKDVFHSRDEYLNLYVLPVFVERVIYFDFFANHRKFHEKAYAKVDAFRKGKEGDGIIHNPAIISAAGIFPADDLQGTLSSDSIPTDDPLLKRIFGQILPKLGPGQWSPVLEWQTHFAVLKIEKKISKERYLVDVASAPKANYEEWFAKESRQIPVRCLEQNLCKDTLAFLR